jgi:hypothetical protein
VGALQSMARRWSNVRPSYQTTPVCSVIDRSNVQGRLLESQQLRLERTEGDRGDEATRRAHSGGRRRLADLGQMLLFAERCTDVHDQAPKVEIASALV